jgi:hypothetical protein
MEGGLFGLTFLRHLTTLHLTLDTPPAFPTTLRDVPCRLRELSLSNMWLRDLPDNIRDMTGRVGVACIHINIYTGIRYIYFI